MGFADVTSGAVKVWEAIGDGSGDGGVPPSNGMRCETGINRSDADLARPARTSLTPGQVLAGNFLHQALLSNVHSSVRANVPVRNRIGISTI